MMTFATDTPRSCGIIELDQLGRMTAFHEKKDNPPGNLANAAVYILEPQVAELASALPTPCLDFSLNVMPHLLGLAQTFHNDWYHRDIGTPGSLALAQFEYPSATQPSSETAEGGLKLLFDRDEMLKQRFQAALASTYVPQTRA